MYSFNKTIYTNNKILREKYMADDKKGMLRHVDVLGRVVIPREVRKALRINYGDLMEFCACSNQQVVMRKFHLIREIADLAISLVSLAQIGRQCDIYIMDTEKVVCKNTRKQTTQNELVKDMINLLNNRKEQALKEIYVTETQKINNGYFLPIISRGDLIGGVLISGETLGDDLIQVGKGLTKFLSDYFDE